MNYIPYGKQYIDNDDIDVVVNVLKSDWITTGPKIEEFEHSICNYIKCNYCTVVNSGTSALDIAVQSLELPIGSEIITTPFTFVATSNSIIYNNCKPIFADICKDTFNINPEDIRRKITKNTKAIIYVDYAGQPCDIKEIRKIADEFNLYLIEDACHALGSEYEKKKIGNFADMTIFSFHPLKAITTGEGGAIVTNNEKLKKLHNILRTHGIDKDYNNNASYLYDMKYLGRNYRMTDFQSALGISQLKKLDAFISNRTVIANKYNELLKNIDYITTPFTKNDSKHAWHIYTIILENFINRDHFFKYMKSVNIGVNVHYIPVYRHSYYVKKYGINPKDFPITEEIFRRIITLPLNVNMTNEEITYICDKIKNYKG